MSSFPHPGIEVHKNQHGITVLKLHYLADPDKAKGEPIFVPALNRKISPWAFDRFSEMTDPNLYEREFEINAEATQGKHVFNLDAEATLEKSFPIPPDWTRRMSLDPHPSVPHAFLWGATDKWGDRWYYREMWPSKVGYKYDGEKLIGTAGPCADDEPVIRIKDYVETVKYLESKDNPENVFNGVAFDERIYARVIDYTARAFGKGSNDDPEQPNFQARYEQYMVMPETRLTCPYFQDAKKDHEVGFEMVNAGLKPRFLEVGNGKMKKTSRIHIFEDSCPELVYQLKNNRREMLTPQQAQTKDPTGKMVRVRTHQTDNLRYIEMAEPTYIDLDRSARSDWSPRVGGIAY